MHCRKFTRARRGFSLVEVVVVLSIVAIFASSSEYVYRRFRSQSNLAIGVGGVVEALRLAQRNAEMGNGDSSWGVYLASTEVTVFLGASYAARDTNRDKILALPSGVHASDVSEIVFAKRSGTTIPAVITLLNENGESSITISERGTLVY